MTTFPLSAVGALPVLDPVTVLRKVLPNGLTVLARRAGTGPVVAIVHYVRAGYFDETDDVVGIAHVLEHMFFKGTERRGVGEIAKETKESGGYLNAATIYDHTSYYTVLPAASFARGLEIQHDAFVNSAIDAGELAKELEVIIQEAKRKADNPGAVVTETLYELLHDTHRIRRWRIGREPGLRALRREDLVRFYRNFYRPSNTVLAVAGDVDPEDAMAEIERLYGRLPDAPIERSPGPAEAARDGFRFRSWSGDIAQTQVAAGWRTPGTLHEDAARLDLAAAVLGTGRASRLYRAVRERQLASSVSAYNYTPTELGVFVVSAEAPPERAAEAARAMWAQVAALRSEGVAALDLERARRILEARWVRRFETAEGQANYLAEWEALGDWRLGDRYLEQLLTTGAEEVSDAVRRYLTPERAALAVYTPAGAPAFASDASSARRTLDEPRPAPLPSVPARSATPAPPPAPATLEREEAGVRVYRFGEGVPVLVRTKPGAPLVTIGVFAAVGAAAEPAAHAGLTTLMARTALKGTRARTAVQIAEDAELLGGTVGVSVGAEVTGWTLGVPARHAAAAAELLADVVQDPTFPPEALDTERAIALADVAAMRDDMYRYPVRLLVQAAYAGHPYATPASGTEETLPRVTTDEVRRWHAERVLGGETVVAVVGDVDADDVAALVAARFGALRAGAAPALAAPAWPDETRANVEQREKAQTALALAFPAPARTDAARHAAQLLAGIASGLGGRFFDELRDRQSLAYTVHAHASERRLAGLFVAYIATSPEKEEVAREGLLAEFAKFRDAPVSDEELRRAQTYAIGTHAIRQESGGAVLADVVDAWLLGRSLDDLRDYDAQVRAVGPADIQRVAADCFDPTRRVEGVVRGVGKAV